MRIMMLPLLPEELATPEVLGLIHRDWAVSCPGHLEAFNSLIATITRTYVGTRPGDPARVQPQYHQSIWCVGGMSIRTNNAAESVHAQLKPKVNGKVSLYNFLSNIEEEMSRARKRLGSECESESRRVEPVKNTLLAEELHKLMNGQEGIMCFLDNCASITKLKSLSEAGQIELLSSTSTLDEEWVDANRGLLAAAAHGLYHRLHPGGQLHDDEIVTNVAAWSFRVLDPIIVERRDDEELSLVEEGLHKSFLDLQEKKEESRRPRLEDETRPCSERRGV